MRAQTKIWISIAASLAVSALMVYFAFSILREMSHDFARYQGYSEIINEAFALNILIDDALKEGPNARKIQQIGQVRGSLSKALESISSSNSREESLIRQIRRNNQELGPLIEQLVDQKEGSSGSIDTERRNLLASQLWVKVRFITDDVNRLMETSGARIVSAQVQTSLIVLILIAVAILSNAIIYFFSSRSIVRAQEELRESQRQAALLADLMESSSQPFGTVFPDGRLGMCNTAFPRLLGYSKEELFALDWVKDLTPPEWLEKEAAILEELHRTGQPVRYEKEYRRKDGTRVPVELLVHLRRDEQGEPAYYYAFITDITMRKRVEEALRESEEHYRSLFDNMLNGYAYCQMLFDDNRPVDFIYVNVNHAFEALAGLTDVEGKRVSEVIPGLRESDPQLLETYGRVSLTGIPEQFETHVEALGMWFSVSVYSPRKEHFVAIFDVITARKQAEAALRESEERFRLAMDATSDGLWDWDTTTDEVYYSPSYYRILGYEPGGFPATLQAWKEKVHPEDWERTLKVNMDCIEGRTESFAVEYRLQARTGEWRWILGRGKCLTRDAQGRATRLIGTHVDITVRKQAEENLQRTLADLERSNRELENFAYISSHDMQEPLRQIANFSEVLAKEYGEHLDERGLRFFNYITAGANRMQALIIDLLAYSSVDQPEIQKIPVSLDAILQETLSDLQSVIRKNGAEISADPLPTLNVNPNQMGQVLQNLINNAIKFHNQHSSRIHLSARLESGEWVISIRDNGIGFDPEYAEDIFKVFKRMHSQEKYPGTGIGLAICKKIVERHGGRIWAESQPGQGATFYFTIPA